MNRPLQFWAWRSTVRLIGLLMPISIFAIAFLSHWVLQLNWGASVLLGAILAPTDPVLASEVQLTDTQDRDELRFALTSEGGLNDALAFPFVYFGLHWLKNPNWQAWIGQWVLVDLVWAIAAGIGMGVVVAKTVIAIERWVQRRCNVDEVVGDFIALSTILLTYSLTEIVNGYGFLAVFVAGIMMQRKYRQSDRHFSLLAFTERIEKLLEVGVILLLGSLLRVEPAWRFLGETLLIAGVLIFLIRPLGTWLSTIGAKPGERFHHHFHPATRWLMGWFGIRGVGSLYYLSYALGEGLRGDTGEAIAWITFLTIAISVILHGVSSTPLMNWYEQDIKRRSLQVPAESRIGMGG